MTGFAPCYVVSCRFCPLTTYVVAQLVYLSCYVRIGRKKILIHNKLHGIPIKLD